MLLILLGGPEVRVHSGVVDKLTVLLPAGTSFTDRRVKVIIPVERPIGPIQSRPVAIISEYTHQRTSWLYWRTIQTMRVIQMCRQTTATEPCRFKLKNASNAILSFSLSQKCLTKREIWLCRIRLATNCKHDSAEMFMAIHALGLVLCTIHMKATAGSTNNHRKSTIK